MKKPLLFMMAALLMFSLAACSEDTTAPTENSLATKTPEAESTMSMQDTLDLLDKLRGNVSADSSDELTYAWESNYKVDSYVKYTTKASVNNLDGTMLKIEGTIADRYDADGTFAWIIETSEGERWTVILEKDYDLVFSGVDTVTIYGFYMGIAQAMDNLPALLMLRYVYDGNDVEYKLFASLYESLTFDEAQALWRGEEPESSAEPIATTKPGGFNAASVEKQIGVTEYKWSTPYGHYIAYVLENNSEHILSIGIDVLFKDAAGKNIGASSRSEAAIEPGVKTAFIVDNDDAFSDSEYTLDISQERYYTGVVSSLEMDINTTKDKAIITVMNNGDIAAEFVEYTVLFFKGDAVVDYGWGYTSDLDSEIKPGKSQSAESRCYEDFDTAIVFLTGRGSK